MASSSRRVARSERDCAASHSAAQTAAAGMGLAIMGDQSRDLAIESDQTGTLGDAALRSEEWPGLLGGVCGKRVVSGDQALLAGAAKLLFGSGDERVQVEAREPRVVGERARERLPQ